MKKPKPDYLPEGYKLLVDSREPESCVKRIKNLGINHEVKLLPVGDYVVVDSEGQQTGLIVERKAINDYFGSLTGGRLFNQAINMRSQSYPFIIVVGNMTQLYFAGRKNKGFRVKASVNSFIGSRARLHSLGVSVEQVDNEHQFLYLVCALARKLATQEHIPEVLGVSGKSPEKVPELLLQCLPGIGHKTAVKILDVYDVLVGLKPRIGPPNSLDDLLNVPDIGEKKLKTIKPFLTLISR